MQYKQIIIRNLTSEKLFGIILIVILAFLNIFQTFIQMLKMASRFYSFDD